MLAILVGILLLSMHLVNLMQADPARLMAGANATPEAVQAIWDELQLGPTHLAAIR